MKTYWLVEISYDDGTISARLVGSIRAEDWFVSHRLADRLANRLVDTVREEAIRRTA